MTLLTNLVKQNQPSAYDRLINETGYFEQSKKQNRNTYSTPVVAVKKLVWNNIPQTPDALVARLHADKARVGTMTDVFGKEIVAESIEKLSAFLTLNNIKF